MENCFHATESCPHAWALRHACREHYTVPDEEHLINSRPDWLLLLLDRYLVEIRANFLMLIWRCWSVRNSVLQAGEQFSITGSVLFLKLYAVTVINPTTAGSWRRSWKAEDVQRLQGFADSSNNQLQPEMASTDSFLKLERLQWVL